MGSFAPYFEDDVDLEPFDGLNQDGSETFGAKQTGLPAHVENLNSIDDDASDDRTTVLMEDAVAIDDRLTLPGGETMRVQEVKQVPHPISSDTLYKVEG